MYAVLRKTFIKNMKQLSTTDHSRDIAGLKYIYPVLSRRAGGVSIGINFNTNNACNWHCVYCQVPDLQRGVAPLIDFTLLENELHYFFQHLQAGAFYTQFNVPQALQQIKDIALSGNGEPTSVQEFARAIDLVAETALSYQILPDCHFVLITNGSLVHQKNVQQGLQRLQHYGGEVWFKIDSASLQGRKQINDCRDDNDRIIEKLQRSSQLCHSKIQTCLFDYSRFPWDEQAQQDFVRFFQQIKTQCNIREVMLYTLARPSLQPEAKKLRALTPTEMNAFAQKIERLGFSVSVA